jgi:hypothetical protein
LTTGTVRTNYIHHEKAAVLCLFLLLSSAAWGSVFILWGESPLPPASSLGVNNVFFYWKSGVSPSLFTRARKQGYRVYLEAPLPQAAAAAGEGAKAGCTGIILNFTESDRAKAQTVVNGLRSAYPKLTFLMLAVAGKRPQMRGSLIMKRDSILEVSSPTMQPWIDTNLAAIKVAQRAQPSDVPLYTFSWGASDEGPPTVTASDYSLAIAEAGAFHAGLVLQVDDHLQRGLSHDEAAAWTLWNEVRSMVKFNTAEIASKTEGPLEPAANVAVVLDQLDSVDEVPNLLARHNIPFKVLLTADLTAKAMGAFDVVVVFTKPDKAAAEQIVDLATRGKTVVLVDAHGTYPWQNHESVRLNEHAVSYALGDGKILELSEPVSDPEIFAQDIRRLLGKRDSLLSLWNGLTTVAVPYKDRSGTLKVIEFVNYATDPIRVQMQVKGWFTTIRYETPEHGCCEVLVPVKHDAFTEFVIPQLRIGGRVHLDRQLPSIQ